MKPLTWLQTQNIRLEESGHELATWTPGDAMGTRYRIVRKGLDYDAESSVLTAIGKKEADVMVTAFTIGFHRGHHAPRQTH